MIFKNELAVKATESLIFTPLLNGYFNPFWQVLSQHMVFARNS